MLSRGWSGFSGVPADLVRTGYAISGIFDLAPLIGTSINEAVGLREGTARAASPLFRPPPPQGRRLIAAVGGDESSQFLKQAQDIADGWSKVGIDAKPSVIEATNHFTVLDALITPGSRMLEEVVMLARAHAG
jgi:arylformamidase